MHHAHPKSGHELASEVFLDIIYRQILESRDAIRTYHLYNATNVVKGNVVEAR